MEFSKFKLRSFVTFVAIISCTLLLSWSCKKDSNMLSVNQTELTFSANETGEKMVVITTDASDVVCTPSMGWIKATVHEGNTLLSVSVDPHLDSSTSRTGTITLSAGSASDVIIKVTQEAKATLSLSQTSLTIEADDTDGKTINIISSTEDWTFTATDASWLTCTKNNNSLIVKANNKNAESQERRATITVTAGSADPVVLIVTQKPTANLTVSTNSMSLEGSASSDTFIITSNTNWTVDRGTATWLTVSPSSGSNNGTITVSASANTSASSRSATITVSGPSGSGLSQTVNVTQGGSSSLTVSTTSISFSNVASSRTFTINSNTSWTVSSNASWLTVSPSSGSNNGTITLSASANTSTSIRTATITVSGGGMSRTITATQPGSQPPATAQVRFRKLIYTSELTRLGVFTTGGSELASYNFGASTGTSSYSTITSGTHQPRFYEGSWTNMSSTFNFQANRRYTVELTSETTTTWRFTFYEDGSATTQRGVMINDAIQQPEVFDIPKNR